MADENELKYKLALEFINHILINCGRTPIINICDFKNIPREDILREENLRRLNEMEPKLYKYFDKVKCGYYRKTHNYVITFLRNMVKELGHDAKSKRKDIMVDIDGKKYKKAIMVYYIQ